MKQFTHKKYTQSQVSKILATETNLGPGGWQMIKQTIWVNPTDEHNLRLNNLGLSYFQRAGFTSYKIEIEPKTIANKHLLLLQRYFPSVYFIGSAKTIVVFDEEIASLLILMNGNLIQFLENLANQSVSDNQ